MQWKLQKKHLLLPLRPKPPCTRAEMPPVPHASPARQMRVADALLSVSAQSTEDGDQELRAPRDNAPRAPRPADRAAVDQLEAELERVRRENASLQEQVRHDRAAHKRESQRAQRDVGTAREKKGVGGMRGGARREAERERETDRETMTDGAG